MNWDPEGKPRKPDILGIGAQKAGTLVAVADAGPASGVWAPFKEAQFFNHRFIEDHRKWLLAFPPRPHQHPETLGRARAGNAQEMQRYLDRITREPMFTNHWYKLVFAPRRTVQGAGRDPEYSTLPEEGLNRVEIPAAGKASSISSATPSTARVAT